MGLIPLNGRSAQPAPATAVLPGIIRNRRAAVKSPRQSYTASPTTYAIMPAWHWYPNDQQHQFQGV